jgi:hypothetical protein
MKTPNPNVFQINVMNTHVVNILNATIYFKKLVFRKLLQNIQCTDLLTTLQSHILSTSLSSNISCNKTNAITVPDTHIT